MALRDCWWVTRPARRAVTAQPVAPVPGHGEIIPHDMTPVQTAVRVARHRPRARHWIAARPRTAAAGAVLVCTGGGGVTVLWPARPGDPSGHLTPVEIGGWHSSQYTNGAYAQADADPVAIPEPGTLAVFAIAVLLLVCIKRFA